jgi:hypothetical protein
MDELPAEWEEVFEQRGFDCLSVAGKGLNGSLHVDRVPERDCRRDEGQPARPVSLLFEAALSGGGFRSSECQSPSG